MIAVVGSQVITAGELVDAWPSSSGRSLPGAGVAPTRFELLEQLVEERALVERARQLGLESEPAVRRELDAVLLRHLRARELEADLGAIDPSGAELEAWWTEHADAFARPRRVRAALVQIDVSARAEPAVRERARSQAEALRGEAEELGGGFHGFGPIAARASAHRASRYKGGDVGWLVVGEPRAGIERAVLDAIHALEAPGEIGPIVEGERGFYLVRLLEIDPGGVPPFETVRTRVRHEVVLAEQLRAEQAWRAQAVEHVRVEVDHDRLEAVELPVEQLAAESVRGVPPPPALPSL